MFPVGSDKLSEELRQAYPNCSTLRARKHMAAIDFLRNELQHMQTGETLASSNHHLPVSKASPQFDITTDSRSQYRSPSPMSFTSSVAPESHSIQNGLLLAEAAAPTSPAPQLRPSSDVAQQFVFSIVDGRPLQPKTKRCMTREEKIAYKKTRKRGACLSCRRTKGKVRRKGHGDMLALRSRPDHAVHPCLG